MRAPKSRKARKVSREMEAQKGKRVRTNRPKRMSIYHRHKTTNSARVDGKHTKMKGARDNAVSNGTKYGEVTKFFRIHHTTCERGTRKVRSVHLLLQLVHVPCSHIGSMWV